MKRMLALPFLCLALVSCENANIKNEGNILDAELRSAFHNINQSKIKTRSTLLFANNESADNCVSYWRMVNKSPIVETIENQLVKSEYLICDGLLAVSGFGLYPDKSAYDAIGKEILDRLDLRAFPNSLHRLATNDAYSLKSIYPKLSVATGNTVVFESADWVITFRVVAIVDANKNAHEDWLLQMADESRSGNYRNYASFIVYDVNVDNILKAVPFP